MGTAANRRMAVNVSQQARVDRCGACQVHHTSTRIRQISRHYRTSCGRRQMAIKQARRKSRGSDHRANFGGNPLGQQGTWSRSGGWYNTRMSVSSSESCRSCRHTGEAERSRHVIRLMSDCLLRISEAVAADIEDIDTTLTIRSSKTDQEGKGESLFIGEPTLEANDTYCKASAIESRALFRRIRRGGHITPERLTAISVRRIIKK